MYISVFSLTPHVFRVSFIYPGLVEFFHQFRYRYFGTEFFRLVKGTRPAGGATLDDLFAGLDAAQ